MPSLNKQQRHIIKLVYPGKKREDDLLAETPAAHLKSVKAFFIGSNNEWHNMIIWGDNLTALKTLLQWKEQGKLINADNSPGVRLIYIDPPFASKQEYISTQEERAYQDRLSGAGFIEFLRQRLILMKHLLADNGSIYIHLDEKKSHYIKVIMDEIFGENHFQREIIWRIGWLSGFKTQAKNWIRNHDVILFYTKSDDFIFNKIYLPYPEGYTRRDGSPPRGPGYPIEDTWNCYELDRLDSIQIMSFSGEKTGFPTQKNENLLERIIRASSNPGDIVLDAFAGSGTTLAVAEKLGRRWIGIDNGKLAVYTMQKRLLSLKKEIGNRGEPLIPKPFILYNTGVYDYSQLQGFSWQEWRFIALHLFQCRDEPHMVGGIQWDGYIEASDVMVFDHLQNGGMTLNHSFINELHKRLTSKAARYYIIAPAPCVTFIEDCITKDMTRYCILRIPNSIINELLRRSHDTNRPLDEKLLHAIVKTVGSDLVYLPDLECEYIRREDKAVIRILQFKSKATAKGAKQKENRETLSMVMVDYNYNGQTFTLDAYFIAEEIKKAGWEVLLPLSALGKHVMIIFLDIYGNEYREVKTPGDFQNQ
ncbi:DNA methyltransferase [Neomoorella humiferrea]|uniref:DNA adenine methyltransferase YhdJ n=1 Tax=Neomoorella humiferrea TaxID=676965 RepID=A0A2T0AWG7_9FIRM|nr:site-specific DNA-methyltransferase [Moorella humiferrea]PRR75084.1 DNA adenine methyltransferase YhdJ [Moorella humiferrea]